MQTATVEELETTTILTKSDDELVIMVDLKDIIIDHRKRELSDARALVMSKSVEEIGLLQPIVLTRDLHLIAGRHRVSAFQILGRQDIPAIIKDFTALDVELAEIDENLCRFDLTDAERSMQVTRRKELYGLKYPQTLDNKKRAELRKKWEDEGKPTNDPTIPNFDSEDAQRDDVKSFIKDTAEKSGRSTSQIRDEEQLGRALRDGLNPEILDLIMPTPAAENKSDLKRLVAEPDSDIQYEAAKAVRDSYDEWVASGSNEKEKSRIVKLGDALSKLQSSPTYENTVTDTGEETLHRTLQKTLKALELSVENPKFKEVSETWTYEGVEDIREDFFRIERLAQRGATILTDIMEAKEKLGKGKGKA